MYSVVRYIIVIDNLREPVDLSVLILPLDE